jgi:hypothetical protein
MTPQVTKQLGVKTKLVADPIMVQLAQGIIRPLFNVTLGLKLFRGGVQVFENFTLCDLNNFDVILGNTFLDAYEVDILFSKSKLRVHAKCGSKLVNLNSDHNSTLAKMGVNFVTLANELELFNFLILMSLKVT